MTRRRFLLAALVLVVIGGGASAARWMRPDVPEVTVESVRKRDLEAIVSASGKIQPKRQVNVSATTMGRVTRLAVEEGQRVRAGQFLLEIDPRSLEGALQRGEASVAAARSALQQARTAVEQARTAVSQARVTLDLARQTVFQRHRRQAATGGRLQARQTSQAPTSIIGIDSIMPMVRPRGRFSRPKSGWRTFSSDARTRP